MSVIEARGISFSYGDAKIIEDISFSAEKDEFVSIIGQSGCGKSTLLRILAGLVKPNGGEVLFMGRRVEDPTRGISFVFQDFALLPWLTNMENIKVGLSMTEMTDGQKERRAGELLKLFGLEDFGDSYPNVLSGGMKQRIGIARAIASNPKVLLMDEPFSSLDALTADTLRSDVVRMLSSRKSPVDSVVMVTHNVEEAVEVSDRVVVLSNKPSSVREIVDIKLGKPRKRESGEFMKEVDLIYSYLKE